jgi:leukotriene-A4 hydrolase
VQQQPTPLSPRQSTLLGSTYKLTSTQNVELSSRYFGIGLKAKDESVYHPTAELLGKVGRMKFVRPLYRGLEEVDRKLALETFEKNKSFYHPICRGMVEKDLKPDA